MRVEREIMKCSAVHSPTNLVSIAESCSSRAFGSKKEARAEPGREREELHCNHT